jgi:hypothetical protein
LGETLAPKPLLREAEALDHGAHGTVEHQDPPFEQRRELGKALRARRGREWDWLERLGQR